MAREKFVPPPIVDPEAVTFIKSGSTLLDLVLGGGWGKGRIANIVGDRSAGKTLLAIEACANYANQYKSGHIRYVEAEAAFDMPYARTMGMPAHASMTEEINTVEKLDADLEKQLKEHSDMLYVLDSLDALSDEKEMEREMGDATYGTGKARMMSEMFRRRVAAIRERNASMLVISQIRDKIGVTFGETKTRSGGRALDFYSSQIVWLAELEKLKRTVLGVDRVVGVKVLANNKKNKLGKPFRRTEFTILFNYGIDDETSMLDWLVKNKADGELDEPHKSYRTLIEDLRKAKDRQGLIDLNSYLREVVTARWERIDDALEPPLSKY